MSAEPRDQMPAQPHERMWRFTWIVIAVVMVIAVVLIVLTRVSGMWG
jgi:hypothetical protein